MTTPMMNTPLSWWFIFNAFLLGALVLDLISFHKKKQPLTTKKAIHWCLFWVTLAALFNTLIFFLRGSEAASQFMAGYIVELSLSIDNLFVFLLLFRHFKISAANRPYILMWGIIGALVMRLLFIIAGIALIEQFHSIIYIFGIFLIYTGIHMYQSEEDKELTPRSNSILNFLKRILPITDQEGTSFFIKKDGVTYATPLFVTLIAIECSDVIFALDSIPAIFGITLDPFIIYTSNAFAILGLRSFYFVLEHCANIFSHLHHGVCAVLMFIGCKMLVSGVFTIPTGVSLLIIALLLGSSIIYSLMRKT